jgi:hypothetical protein
MHTPVFICYPFIEKLIHGVLLQHDQWLCITYQSCYYNSMAISLLIYLEHLLRSSSFIGLVIYHVNHSVRVVKVVTHNTYKIIFFTNIYIDFYVVCSMISLS